MSSIACCVLTGSNKVLSSGIPAIYSESNISKELYSWFSSKSLIMQLNSVWVCKPSENWSFSYVHVASDNSVSLVPSMKSKYILKVKLYPVWIGWAAMPKKVNVIEWVSLLKLNPWICLNDNLISAFLFASSIEIGFSVGCSSGGTSEV